MVHAGGVGPGDLGRFSSGTPARISARILRDREAVIAIIMTLSGPVGPRIGRGAGVAGRRDRRRDRVRRRCDGGFGHYQHGPLCRHRPGATRCISRDPCNFRVWRSLRRTGADLGRGQVASARVRTTDLGRTRWRAAAGAGAAVLAYAVRAGRAWTRFGSYNPSFPNSRRQRSKSGERDGRTRPRHTATYKSLRRPARFLEGIS